MSPSTIRSPIRSVWRWCSAAAVSRSRTDSTPGSHRVDVPGIVEPHPCRSTEGAVVSDILVFLRRKRKAHSGSATTECLVQVVDEGLVVHTVVSGHEQRGVGGRVDSITDEFIEL